MRDGERDDVQGYLDTDHVDLVRPRECVVDGDSQQLEGTNLFNLAAFGTQLQGAATNLPTRVDEHTLCFQGVQSQTVSLEPQVCQG